MKRAVQYWFHAVFFFAAVLSLPLVWPAELTPVVSEKDRLVFRHSNSLLGAFFLRPFAR